MSGADVVLRTEELTKRFGGLVAVDQVSLAVRQREVHAVIGPNGAGKSTLVNLLTGHLSPSGGRVIFRDRDITGLAPNRISQIGIGRSYQRTNVFPNSTCRENCLLAAQSRLRNSFRLSLRGEARQRVEALTERGLSLCGLAHRDNTLAVNLSYGEQRQLELGMVLATDPGFLVLDEPTAGMGRDDSRRVIELLTELKTRYPLVLVEHDMDAVFQLADTLTVMANGQVLATGAPDRVRNDRAVQEAYLGDGMEAM